MPLASADPIRHVVLLMLENRSFDQMLGSLQELFPKLEGIDPAAPNRNRKAGGGAWYEQLPTTIRRMCLDPMHETKNVRTQLLHRNGGFVIDFVGEYGKKATDDWIDHVMGYYERGRLQPLQTLGEHFTICDHWHASVPGPTWANRLFALSGTSLGRVKMPTLKDPLHFHRYTQDTIFDRLDERGVSWAVFHGDFPLSLLFAHQRAADKLERYHDYGAFAEFVQHGELAFPRFVLIEPDYLGSSANDDHPPHDVVRGQALIADVYNTLRSNPTLWSSTLLVILYDEHGGFYDHVVPPSADPPDDCHQEYDFKQLGVRVPALLVSPWVSRGISATTFDHTSLLRYLIDKWSLEGLGKRTAGASSILPLINRSGPARTDYPDRLDVGNPLAPQKAPPLTTHEQAVIALAESIERGTAVAPRALAARAALRGSLPVAATRFRGLEPEQARDAARRAARRLIESARAAAAPPPQLRKERRGRRKARARGPVPTLRMREHAAAGSTVPRGLRNNNPGNIRKGAPWQGLAPSQPDPSFCTFTTMAYGVRAIARILRSYAGRGIDTLRAFAARWAPSGDHNDPVAYARTVLRECAGTASTIDQRIDLLDDGVRLHVIRGIVVMENGAKGSSRVSNAVIREGIRLERT